MQLNAQDSFSNTGSLAYKTVTVDNSPPSISINYENKPITSNVTVFGLKLIPNSARRYADQTLVNSHDASRWTVSDAVELSWVNLGNDLYTPNYPKDLPVT